MPVLSRFACEENKPDILLPRWHLVAEIREKYEQIFSEYGTTLRWFYLINMTFQGITTIWMFSESDNSNLTCKLLSHFNDKKLHTIDMIKLA